jgi:hypothetical protein
LADHPTDAIAALREVHSLLAAHPSFKIVPVRSSSPASWGQSSLGRVIRELRLVKFGAKFDRVLTLLYFRIQKDGPRRISLDLQWHATRIGAGWSVFIHFVDAAGEIRFQGDYALEGQTPDALGFLYSRRRVDIPTEVPEGTYRVRLGVWSPPETRHLRLSRVRGCLRERAEWCRNAVILATFQVSENETA